MLKRFWTIVVAVLGLLLPSAAYGLSCARPSLDEAAIEAAVVIFEGTAGPKRALDSREEAVIRTEAIESIGGSLKDLRVYSFTVAQGWKGATAGRASISFSTPIGGTVSPRARPTWWSARDRSGLSSGRRFAATRSI